MAETHERFPERLRKLSMKEEAKRHVISQLCGLNPDMIRRYENGEAKPSAESLAKMADYFGVSMDYLYGLSDDPGRNA